MPEAIISPEALLDMEDISLLSSQPELGQLKLRLRHSRLWVVTQFPNYLIFYRVRDGAVEVVRVLHGARDLASILQ